VSWGVSVGAEVGIVVGVGVEVGTGVDIGVGIGVGDKVGAGEGVGVWVDPRLMFMLCVLCEYAKWRIHESAVEVTV